MSSLTPSHNAGKLSHLSSIFINRNFESIGGVNAIGIQSFVVPLGAGNPPQGLVKNLTFDGIIVDQAVVPLEINQCVQDHNGFCLFIPTTVLIQDVFYNKYVF